MLIEWLCIVIWPIETIFGIYLIIHGGINVNPMMQDAALVDVLLNALFVSSYLGASACFKGSLDMLKEEREFNKFLKSHRHYN